MNYPFNTKISHSLKWHKSIFLFVATLFFLTNINAQIVYNFTNAGATGKTGPTQAQVNATYGSGNTLNGSVTSSSGIQYWTVPYTGTYSIDLAGGSGGSASVNGGRGAKLKAILTLTAGDQLRILVGQQGLSYYSSGGGGGSFVYNGTSSTLLMAAGGGGGKLTVASTTVTSSSDASTSTSGKNSSCGTGTGGTNGGGGTGSASGWGAGGGGYSGNGTNGANLTGALGYAFLNGGVGGTGVYAAPNNADGGFGGGGATHGNTGGGGGGGGYSGGGGSTQTTDAVGGGGGSYVISSANTLITSNGNYNGSSTFGGSSIGTSSYNIGQGYVTITYLFAGGTIKLSDGSSESIETCTSYTPGTFGSTVSASGGQTPYTYQWQFSTDNVNWTNIVGANSATYAPGTDITTTTYFRRKVNDNTTPTANVTYSNTLSVIIDAIPTTSNAGTNIVLCSGTSTTLAANTAISGTGTWSKISGPNTPSFSNANFNTATISGLTTGTYVLEWKISTSTSGNPPSCAVSTSNINLVVGAPSITSSTGGSTCNPGTATLTAAASAGTINWYSSSTGGSSLGTGTSFTTGTLTSTTTYYVDATGGGCTSASRTAVVATVLPNNTISLSSTAGTDAQSKCINAALTNITYSTTGATGATVTGLPTGVTGSWASNVVTISGTPSVAGIFNYTINLTGGCGTITKTGTITVNQASVASVTGVDVLCVAATGTYTATSIVLSGGTGAWSSSNTAIATVNASTGLVTGIAAGTATITYTITGGCGGTVTAQKQITINQLPVLNANSGSTAVCGIGGAVTLTNSSSGGIWASANTSIATVNSTTGEITGIATGVTSITYAVTDVNSCTNTATSSVSVYTLPTTPSSLTATPATLCNAGTVVLTATSSGNLINWYNVATGGSILSTVASGANYTTATLSNTTTYYAEAAFSNSQTFNYTGGLQTYTVPTGVTTITIDAYGAKGGNSTTVGYGFTGGYGARAKTTLTVTPGQVLTILVGGKGGDYSCGAGGGGGSFVVNASNSPLVVAGGGGGAFYCAYYGGVNGGAGLTSTSGGDGIPGPSNRPVNIGGASGNGGTAYYGGGGGGFYSAGTSTQGGATYAGKVYPGAAVTGGGGVGGYGGGGGGYVSCCGAAGGGGGYSGGSSGTSDGTAGGGGGSYIINTGTNNVQTAGTNSGDGYVTITSTSTNPCLSPRVPITVSMSAPASAGTVTGTTSICVGATSTYTATSVVLSGGAGAWSSSNTAVATVNATTGVVTGIAAGSASITYTITGGCWGTVSSVKQITINALPSLSAITGATTVCSVGSTATLSNTTIGGIWSSSNTAIATIDANGIVSGVAIGNSTITYSLTDINTCSNTVTKSIVVSALPTTPTTLVANPATLCNAGTAILTATSTGNLINWYNVATGGSILGTVASGANYTTGTISNSTTFYAEAAYASGSQTFNYTGAVQTYTVPAGVTAITFEVWGAQGGTGGSNVGGNGGYAKGTYSVTPGSTINIYVGGQGTAVSNNVVGGAGWNGGGNANGSGGGGGGASDIRVGGTALANRVIVAGGGGGGGYYSYLGGQGGGLTGITGGAATNGTAAYGGGGGTQSAGGASTGTYPGTSGSLGIGGNGGIATSSIGYSGGGGGGYYGGSGGAGAVVNGSGYGSGGGGGSSYIAASGLTNTSTIAGNASMPNPAGGANILGRTGNGIVKISFTNSPCLSPRVPLTVSMSAAANAGTITTTTSTICVGATSTFTATNVILAGGTGAWSSSNTAVATVNATTGIITGVSAGTASITYTITGGCGGIATAQKAIVVKALPVVGAISGNTTICDVNGTTTLTNATAGGVWSSTNTNIATINTSGVVTGVAVGNILINYTVTNSDGCVTTNNTNISVSALPTTPSSVTATPATLCSGSLTTLNAVSTGSLINWYNVATGGSILSTVASGANYTPTAITSAKTFYAEAAYASGAQTFNYTGAVQTYTVPAGVTSINFELWGAKGGTGYSTNLGGNGGYAKGSYPVTPGTVINIYVGGQGGFAGNTVLGGGGWNGGGNANGAAGGGGGASDIRIGGTALSNRIIVAGGGGGAGYYSTSGKGAGGGLTGVVGGNATNGTAAYGGSGGTQIAGGAAGGGTYPGVAGTLGVGGIGGNMNSTYNGYAGGGGGGYYGGGGGAGVVSSGSGYGGGGGGGSSYIGDVNLFNTLTIAGDASMSNPAGGANVVGNAGNGVVKISFSNPCLSPRVPIVVNLSPSASVSSVTGNTTVCIGSSATYTATNVVLAGGTGAWSSSNTAVATVNATTGIITTVSAGTTNIVYTIAGGCGSATAQKTITIAALPVVANISGSSVLCNVGATTTFTNATLDGVWSSTNTAIATIDEFGVVNALAIGNTNISYTVTDINACTNSAITALVVSALPTTPSALTASPATLCNASTVTLNATSTGSLINWYNVATGGSILSTVSSGVNYTTGTLTTTTTYYAQAAYASGSQTFNYTGSVQTYTVPAGVTSINFELWGAKGAVGQVSTLGGNGGYAKGSYPVTPGTVINIYVGGQGTSSGNTTLRGAGWNGGGNANGAAGGGGGASDIRIGGTALSNRIIVAGGGGGAGYYSTSGKGAGGGLTGVAGGNATNGTAAYGGGGGTQIAGGAAGGGTYPGVAGTLGVGGDGGNMNSTYNGYAGGGGGGYYGGGGGAGVVSSGSGYGGGGGGGSSYIGAVNLFNTQTIAGDASMPNPAGGTNVVGNAGNGVVKISFSNPCLSPRVPITINTSTAASAGTISGTAAICAGATGTYTATGAVLAGGTGAWSSSNTAVANVNATTGVVTAVAAGSATISYTITGGCWGTVAAQKVVTVNALPVLAAISGANSICKNTTTTFTNTTSGGVWTSTNSSIATITNNGVITAIADGSAVITYTYTNNNSCASTITKTITVAALPADPSSVTATPNTLLSGATTILSAISNGNKILWYDVASGGTALSTINSGETYTTTVNYTTTYYVESKTQTQILYNHTGAQQTYIVPAGVTSIDVEAWGAQGGSAQTSIGGKGGYAKGVLAVTPGETLYINVGGKGTTSNTSSILSGGFNGGGSTYGLVSSSYAGSGGGASDIRKSGTALSNRVIVAGGGGGGGYFSTAANGGAGGGTTGLTGTSSGGYTGGGGGTQSAGGAAGTTSSYSSAGTLGNGGNSTGSSGGWNGSAGGGGYYGGGSGGALGAGGGGGSSYIGGVTLAQTISGNASMPNPNGGSNITGNTGDGVVKLTLSSNICTSATRIPIVVTVANMSTLTSTAISNVGLTTASSGGVITNDGGTPITARGVCWSTSANPTIANSKTVDGSGTGTFASSITGLTNGTTYYVRAYATNAISTSYGGQYTLTTLTVPVINSFTPTTAGTNVPVTITGTNFNDVQSVQFGGVNVNSFTINSSTSITALPASGATGEVMVTSPGGTATKTTFTYMSAPSLQASSVLISGLTNTQASISWTNGNGSKRVVFISANTIGTANPSPGITYTANANYTSGTQIGSTGWYCVYNGTGATVNVSGLSPMTNYRVMVLEYNGASAAEVYYTNAYSGNPINTTTLGPTINTSVTSLNNFTNCLGTASARQVFTVSGQYLTANITATAPQGFEISTSDGSNYGSTVTLTPSAGTVTSTNIYVRVTSAASGTVSGTVTFNSTNASTKTVLVAGTVSELSVAGSISGNNSVCIGTNSVDLSLTGNAGSIQWKQSSNNITYTDILNATSATVTVNNLTATTYFKAYVTNGACSTVSTNVFTITANNQPVSATLNLSAAAGAVCLGTNLNGTIANAGTGGAGTVVDVLQYQYDGGVWNTYTLGSNLTTVGHNDIAIKSVRTVTGSGCSVASPNIYAWTVNQPPSIVSHPSTSIQAVCQNATAASLTVSASGAGLNYQWYKNTSNSNTGGTAISGATSATYTPSTVVAGSFYYYVVVSGTCTPNVSSNVSGLYTISGLPTITVQPSSSSQSICLNASATDLSVTATGGGISYQWYENASNNNTSGTLISGATSATYKPLTNVAGTKYYYVKVSGTCSPEVISSVSGAITTNTLPSVQISQGTTLSLGASGAIQLTANANSGTPAYSYQWYKAGVEVSSVPNSGNAYNLHYNVSNTGLYTVKVTDANGCKFTSQQTNIQALPTMSINGSDEICEGASVSFIFDASSLDPLGLEWQSSTDNINWYPIQNGLVENGGLAAVQKYTVINTGFYRIAYTSAGNTTYTTASDVTVHANPIVSITPSVSLINLCTNTALNFTASATAAGTYTYTWTSNGSVVGNTDQLAISNDGIYSLKMTDSYGCYGEAVSSPVVFNPLPTATIVGTTAVCEAGNSPQIQFAGNSASSPYVFKYTINGGSVIETTAGVNTVNAPTNDPGTFIYNLVGVRDAIGCYQAMTGSATITVNPLPTLALGTVDPISMAATNAILPFTNAQNSPDIFAISAGTRALQNYYNVSAAALNGSSINLIVPASAAGTYDFNLTTLNTNTGCRSIVYPFELTIVAPNVTTVGTLSALSTNYGTASTNTRFKVAGTYMVSDITVTAPTGFEISTSATSGFASTITMSPVNESIPNTFVYVRLKANAQVTGSPYSGDVVISSSSMANINLAIPSSTVNTVPLQIMGISINNKTYDGNDVGQIVGNPYYTGLQNNENIQVTGTGAARFSDANVELNKVITISGYTSPNSNYTLLQPSGLTANIDKAHLTVTAQNQSVQEGTSDNTVLSQASNIITGYVNYENASVITGTVSYNTTYSSNALVGTASLTLSPDVTGLSATNYDFNAVDGYITVTINPTSYISVTGSTNYVYNAQAQGPSNAIVVGSTGLITYSYSGRLGTNYGPSVVAPIAAGDYQVVATVASDQVYHAATSSAYNFTIAKKQLALRTRNKNINYGTVVNAVVSNVLYDYDGLQGNDNVNAISGATVYTTNYLASSAVGATGLLLSPNISQLSAVNYDITAYAGNITVVDILPVISYTNSSYTFTKNSAIANLTPTVSGTNLVFTAPSLPAGLTINATTGVITGTPVVTNTISTNYTITASNTAGQAQSVLSIRVMPDQPQGNISLRDRAILSTDSVVLKFNFTQGIAPYNAIVYNTIKNTFDTLLNLTNGQFVKTRPMSVGTMYQLVQLSDANNTFRNNAFDNDTASLQILVPKMSLLLSANLPVMLPDSSHRIQLTLKLKNTGQVNLNALQVDASLNKLFAAGYPYKIDTIVVERGTMRINPSYTGIGNSTTINKVIAKGGTRTQYVKSMSTLLGNYLFDNNANLNIGEDAVIKFELSLPKTTVTVPAAVQFSYSALANLPLSNNETSSQVVGALSQDSKPNAISTDTVAQPTIISLFPRPLLASSLHVSSATAIQNGFKFHFTGKLANLGNTNIDSLQIVHSFKKAFSYPDTAYLNSPPTITRGNIVFNVANYNGYSNDTLIDHSGYLPYGDSIIVDYDVVVITNKTKATWLNNLQVIGLSTVDRTVIIDSSVSGLIVDPNNDGLPNETSYTRATVNNVPPIAPTVLNASYLYQTSTLANIRSLVSSYPTGTLPAWCDLVTAKCDTVAPKTPSAIGRYIYEVRSYDTSTLLYSNNAVYDTIYIKPLKPNVVDAKYIIGISTNPANVKNQVVGMNNAIFKYYIGNNSSTESPLVTSFLRGTTKMGVSQIVNTVESDTIGMQVTMLDMSDVIRVQKIAREPQITSNSKFDITYVFALENMLDVKIDSIRVTDLLKDQLPASVDYVTKTIEVTGNTLVANKLFNGSTVINLTSPNSYLGPLQKDSVKLVVNINPLNFVGNIANQATVNAKTNYGAISFSTNTALISIPEIGVVVPAGFSPNNDGIDDKWIIVRPFGTTISVKVFNRWGAEVYSESNYQNTWDGRGVRNFTGEMLTEGTYFYILESKNSKGEMSKMTGSLTIAK